MTFRSVIFRITLLCIACWDNNILAGQVGVQSMRHLTIDDGLSSDHTTCFHQDSQGFMWIGTNEGLCRFDGLHFQNYFQNPKDPIHSLSGNWINGICSYENKLYIATNHGISVFDINRQEFCNDELNDNRYNYLSRELFNFIVLIEDKWYVGGENSLFELNKDFSFYFDISDQIQKKHSNTVRDFLPPASDHQGHLYFASCGDLIEYSPYNKQVELTANMSISRPKPSPGMCHTSSPVITTDATWFFVWATNPEMVTATNRTDILLRSTNPVYDGSTNFCFQDDKNKLWFATENGLFMRDAEGSIQEIILESSATISCFHIYQDLKKNYWIATERGVYYTTQQDESWKIIALPNVSQSKTVYAQDIVWWKESVWLNTNESIFPLIYQLEQDHLTSHTISGLEKGVRSLYPWDEQYLFVGGWKYASLLNAEDYSSSPADFIPENYREFPIIKTLRDQHNNSWFSFGQYNGILRLTNDLSQFTHFVQTDHPESYQRSMPISSAYDMAEDDDGMIWMVRSKLDGKLVRCNPASDIIEEIHPVNAEAAHMHFNGESYCIVANGDAIWFAVMREGLFRYDRKTNTLEQFTRNDGLLSNDIYALEVDKRGVVWMGTAQGLAAMSYPDRTVTHFTKASGLPDQNFSSASLYNFIKDEMYFSANGFLISFLPEALLRPTVIPDLFLIGLHIDGKDAGIMPRHFQAGENHIDFMFTAVDLYNAAGFEYRYRLEGLESTWNESGKNKMASYANIPAGDYTLLVSVKTLGEWSEPKALYRFHLPQFFYKTPLFFGCLAASFCLIVYFIYRFRIRRIKQMESMRYRISRDLHDDIGSALSSIRILSGQRKTTEEQSKETLLRINRSSQQMLDNMDDIIWAIQPENDMGEQLLIRMREFASEVIEAAGMQCNLQLDECIENRHFGLNQKRNVYLIFKEAVNNAVKYSHGQKVSIRFGLLLNDKLELQVTDDGEGFDILQAPIGNGLRNMQRRADELNGELKIISAKDKGTSICLKFELKQHG
ncbi:MAG: hypothetical protein IPP69_18070 [Flavobacteriales bacterium]|nr:hypothetical protein [Flavobacteriales bacterium]